MQHRLGDYNVIFATMKTCPDAYETDPLGTLITLPPAIYIA